MQTHIEGSRQTSNYNNTIRLVYGGTYGPWLDPEIALPISPFDCNDELIGITIGVQSGLYYVSIVPDGNANQPAPIEGAVVFYKISP